MKKLLGLLIVFLVFNVPSTATAKKAKPCKNCYCSITASNVNFGSYDALSKLAVDSAGSVDVECGTDTIGDTISYEIEISDSKSGTKPRELKGKKHILQYNIFTSANHSVIWGDGKGSTAVVADGFSFPVLCCVTRNYTMYGQIFAGQNVAPGLYSQTLTININF